MHTVRYEVGGNATLTALSYRNATGATEQRDARPPWSLEFRALTASYVAVTVFNKADEGTVSCRIYVDGVLLTRGESSGGYKVVHCDGLIGLDTTPTP